MDFLYVKLVAGAGVHMVVRVFVALEMERWPVQSGPAALLGITRSGRLTAEPKASPSHSLFI